MSLQVSCKVFFKVTLLDSIHYVYNIGYQEIIISYALKCVTLNVKNVSWRSLDCSRALNFMLFGEPKQEAMI